MTGNVSLSIPLGPGYQLNDWFGSQLVLHYNSKIWEHDCPHRRSFEIVLAIWSAPDTYGQGVTLHFGRVYHHPKDMTGIYRYQTPDGSDHFSAILELEPEECPTSGGLTTLPIPLRSRSIHSEDGFVAYPGNGTKVILDH